MAREDIRNIVGYVVVFESYIYEDGDQCETLAKRGIITKPHYLRIYCLPPPDALTNLRRHLKIVLPLVKRSKDTSVGWTELKVDK